jgi:hypothetical protein
MHVSTWRHLCEPDRACSLGTGFRRCGHGETVKAQSLHLMSSFVPAASPALADRLWLVRRSCTEEEESGHLVGRLEAGLALVRANISKASAPVPLGATTTGIVSARLRFSGDQSDGRGIEDIDDGRDISDGVNGNEPGTSDLDNELDDGDLLEDDEGSYTHDSDSLLDDDEGISARP